MLDAELHAERVVELIHEVFPKSWRQQCALRELRFQPIRARRRALCVIDLSTMSTSEPLWGHS
jgi:hypothetical protein